MILPIHVARQLWIQLRLIFLLAMPAIATLTAVAMDAAFGFTAGRVALTGGLAAAAVLSAALVGAGFTEEIGSGAAAWLVVRAVPRAALIGAWLALPALAVLLSFVVAGALAGLALPPTQAETPDPVAAVVTIVAAAAPALPLTAAGLAIAVDGPSRVTFAAVLIGAGIVALPLVLLGQSVVHPASGYWLVAGLVPADRPITVGLQAIGLCLALAALGWGVAAARFARRDL
ncbi:MAG: hypothetical protein ACRDFR_05530 [Candidatus Limnocylindria bacterium]